jgi:hypothetical protein
MRGSMNIKLIVRIAVVLFGCDTVKFGRRLRTSRWNGAWATYIMQFWWLEKSVSYKSSGSFGFHSLSDDGQIFNVMSLNGR